MIKSQTADNEATLSENTQSVNLQNLNMDAIYKQIYKYGQPGNDRRSEQTPSEG